MNFLRGASLVFLALGLTACSSSKVVRVPASLTPLDSPLQIERNWQVQLNEMRAFEEKGLNIAQNKDVVFAADVQGLVSAFAKENQSRWTDQVLWQIQLSEKIVSGPVMDEDRLIIGTSKGKVIALSSESGEVVWQTQLSSEVVSRAVISEQKLFTRTVDGRLYALSASTGRVIWVTENQIPNLSLRGVAPVLYHQGRLYIGWETGKVEAVSADSGKSLWESRIAIPRGRTDLERMVDVQASLVIKQDRLFALGYQGKLVAMNLETGNLYYAKDVSGYRDFIVDNQAIYVVDEDDVVHAYDLSNGTKLWSQVGLKYRNLRDLQVYKDSLLAIDGLGYLHWLNKTHGTISARVKHSNEYGDEDQVVQALVEEDRLYLLDNSGTINSYQIEPSGLTTFQTAVESTTTEQGQ